MTCYPTSQTITYQNQYTRVICEYPSLLLQGLCPFGINFTFRAAAGSSLCMGRKPRPPVSHMLPPRITRWPDPTKFGHLAGPPQIPSRILRQGTLLPLPLHLSTLSNTLPFLACDPRDPWRESCAALEWATRTATLLVFECCSWAPFSHAIRLLTFEPWRDLPLRNSNCIQWGDKLPTRWRLRPSTWTLTSTWRAAARNLHCDSEQC